jgi:ATP-binding cassette, subfamily B, bacterial
MQMPPHAMMGADRSALAGKRLDRGVLRRAWQFAHPYRAMVWLFLASIVVTALFGIVPPLVFRRIIDHAIPTKNRHEVTILAIVGVVVAFGDGMLGLVQRWASSKIGEGLIYDLRVTLFDHLQRMPLSFFTATQTGAVISRMNNDVIGAQSALTGTLGSVVSNVVVLITSIAAMLYLDPWLTLLALVVLPLFVIPAKRVGRRLQTIAREQMTHNAAMNTQMTERLGVSGAMLVKLFGSHDTERTAFATRASKVRDAGIRSALYGRAFNVGLSLAGAMGAAAIYGVGAYRVINGSIDVGTLVALSALTARIYGPLTGLTNARVDVMTAMVSFERVFEVLDLPHVIDDRPGAIDLIAPTGQIEFRNVDFSYPIPQVGTLGAPDTGAPSAEILRGIQLVVPAGATVALVGPSGAGKSTLASLVPRLYDVTGGSVLIDGHDVRDLTQTSLRDAIGVVNQDPHLFHETIASNLRYAKPDATDEQLADACRVARILDLINSLPDGFATMVGERGYRLSGGEKQRLAIARMVLKDPAIVILDEATSHLDAENEALIAEAMADTLVNRTALVIAHRLSTIVDADLIAVIDDGRVVERGTHSELMAVDGLYADLYQTLMRGESEGLSPVGALATGEH